MLKVGMKNIIVSFPNAGRTWLKSMTDGLNMDLYYSHQGSQHDRKLTLEDIDNYVKMYPSKFSDAKIMLLHREVKDNMVSNFFQTIYRVGYDFNISDFIRHPHHGAEKMIQFNLYWKNFKNCSQVNSTTYENLKKDTCRELIKIGNYFGYTLESRKLDEVVDHSSFEKMHDRELNRVGQQYYYKYTKTDNTESFKVRRGVVGGYKDYMNSEDIDYCDSLVEKYNYIEEMGK